MNRLAAFVLCVAFLLIAGIAFLCWPRRHRSLTTTDISRPFSVSVSSFTPLPGSGAFYIIVEGQIDGDAVLEIAANHGKAHWEIPLHGEHIAFVNGGTEEWVDDFQMHYRPVAAKHGQLYVSLYCGTGLTADDEARYRRIEPRHR